MKGKMYKLTGLFGQTPRGKFKPGKEPIPTRKRDDRLSGQTAPPLPPKHKPKGNKRPKPVAAPAPVSPASCKRVASIAMFAALGQDIYIRDRRRKA